MIRTKLTQPPQPRAILVPLDGSELARQGRRGAPDGLTVDARGNLFATGPGGLLARPWGLREAWFTDPDGLDVVLVEVPAGHPIRSRLTV